MIVPVTREAHHRAHLEPILAYLPWSPVQRSKDDIALVASYGGLMHARRARFSRIILAQHGAGQSYGGDKKMAEHPSYPGGSANGDVGLFLAPNEHSADRWRRAYPQASVAVVGCPRLDVIPERVPGPGPVIAFSFHWDFDKIPEMRSASGTYWRAIAELAKRHRIIGHGHPKRRDIGRYFRSIRVPFVADFDEVCRRADVYACDNSSTMFEFAATGRPVIVLNRPEIRDAQGIVTDPGYRRSVSHGLRFWDAAGVGVNVDDPAALEAAVRLAVEDPPDQKLAREAALDLVYAYRSGAAERAAAAIREWAGIAEAVAA